MRYDRRYHAAASTTSYVFGQLIPYIGNKRKLLDLIAQALAQTGSDPRRARFLDAMAGSGVVSRWAKQAGFEVVSNDWEPYTAAINGCYIACNTPPIFARRPYDEVIAELNALAPGDGWVTRHLCPRDDANPDLEHERMFYMRKNGRRIDAIRSRIAEWDAAGGLTEAQRCGLLAPLLYQACYTSNTSGVFKGFHRGWGGQTGTALSRIASDLRLSPAVFFDNGRRNQVFQADAADLAASPRELGAIDIVYLDPPYNQHPYGSNYHVLNSVTLWDHPALEPTITRRGDKSAIRHDWRARRSPYNRSAEALAAHERLLAAFECPMDRDQLQHRWQHRPAGTAARDGRAGRHERVSPNVQALPRQLAAALHATGQRGVRAADPHGRSPAPQSRSAGGPDTCRRASGTGGTRESTSQAGRHGGGQCERHGASSRVTRAAGGVNRHKIARAVTSGLWAFPVGPSSVEFDLPAR